MKRKQRRKVAIETRYYIRMQRLKRTDKITKVKNVENIL